MQESKPSDKDLIAIALDYNKTTDTAPKVVATGKGYIAEKIIEIAKKHQITIHKDKELADVLSLLDVNSVIPIEAYSAVAEILSYIYKTNAQYKKERNNK